MIPSILIADCEVNYDGRASTQLERGVYLIIYKPDKSLAIHGSKSTHPLNYQNGGTEITYDENNSTFTAKNKNETVIIRVFDIIDNLLIPELSENNVKIIRSEKDLVDKLEKNIGLYVDNVKSKTREASTAYGSIDFLVIDNNDVHHIFEVKRGKIAISGCGQLTRYANFYKSLGKVTKEYMVGPNISQKAKNYCEQNNQVYIKLDFDHV